MDAKNPTLKGLRCKMADVEVAGSQLSIMLTTLASQSPRISGRAIAIASDVSFIANVLSELDEIVQRTVSGRNGETKILSEKGINTISTHSDTCLRIFGTMSCEVDNQLKARYGCPSEPKMSKAAEDVFLEPRMDQLRLEVKEAKEALLLVLQVALLARSRIIFKAGNEPFEDPLRSCLGADQESLLIRVLKAKVSTRKPLSEDANSHEISPDNDTHDDGDRSQEDTLDTVDLKFSGSSLKSPLDTTSTLAPFEDEHKQVQKGSDLPDEDVESVAQNDDSTTLTNQSQTRGKRSTVAAAEVKDPSSSTKPPRSRLAYIKREDAASASRPRPLDTRRECEGDERSLKSAVGPVGTPTHHSTKDFSRYQQVSCLTMLRLLLSPRTSDRRHVESAEDVVENLHRGQVLAVVILRPYIRFTGQGYFVGWSNLSPETEQLEIARQLVSDRRKDTRLVTEQIAKLSITEAEVIGGYMKVRPDAYLLSVSSTPVDLEQDGIKLRGIPETRFIFRMADVRQRARLTDLSKLDQPPPPGNRRDRPSRSESFTRPTYMKISLEFLDPRTLNAFNLPWEFDPDNQYMVIVKKYITVEDQDVLFDHTKKIRQHDLFRSVPSKALKDHNNDDEEDENSDAEPSKKPAKSEVDSLFLRVDSRKELEEENKRAPVAPAVSNVSSSSDGELREEETDADVVELLLAKYTTVFDEPPAANVEPAWIPL